MKELKKIQEENDIIKTEYKDKIKKKRKNMKIKEMKKRT